MALLYIIPFEVIEPAAPRGFALSAQAFRQHMLEADLAAQIYPALAALDPSNVAELARLGSAVRWQLRMAPLPREIELELRRAYAELCQSYGDAETEVAVRSSAAAEDLPTASFADHQESYIKVRGPAALLEAVRNCMASLFTDRAIAYRAERGLDHAQVALSVDVQK